MKFISIKLFILSIFLIPNVFLASNDELLNLEEILVGQHDWVLHLDEKETSIIWISKNGEITHGDSLGIRILEGDCEIGNTVTTFYSTKKIVSSKAAEGQFIKAKFGGESIHVQVMFAVEFLMGNSIWVDLGWNSVTAIKDFFKAKPKVTLQLEYGEDFNIEEYFDVKQNAWQTEGIDEALDSAVRICKGL